MSDAATRANALDHIVVVLFENRSFDNLLGHLYGPEDGKTFEGVIGKGLANPIPEWAEHGADRKVVPYTVATDIVGWDGSLRGAPPATAAPTSFDQLLEGLVQLRPIAITQLGLLVLIATPVVRVGVSVVGFAREHDLIYVAITLAVLLLLLASLFLIR